MIKIDIIITKEVAEHIKSSNFKMIVKGDSKVTYYCNPNIFYEDENGKLWMIDRNELPYKLARALIN